MILSKIKSPEDYIFVNFYFGMSVILTNVICLYWLVKKKYLVLNSPKKLDIITVFKRDYKLTFSQLLLSLQQYSPILLIGYFGNNILAGQYKIIEQIISLFRTFNQVYLKYFFPRLCYKITLSINDALIFWRKNLLILLIGVIIALLLIFLSSQEIISYFNIEIDENAELIRIMKFSLIIPFLMVFSLSLEQLMLAFNKNRGYIKTTISVTIINFILLLILTPIFELHGIIFSLVIAEVFFIFLYYRNTITSQKQ